ncbi:MAG: DUF1934 domain-containing protein [Eubacterium sp.]|nr:DUF1934 domain-containing protein [Eubacterium sp.]
MKDIMLKIIGRQFIGDDAEDNIEFVTSGQFFAKDGANYIVYKESELLGFPGCMTTLKLSDGAVKLRRFGEDKSITSEMEFRIGERISSKYDTPYGEIAMEVMTNDIKGEISKEGKGTVSINYDVSLAGIAEGRNEITIEVDGGRA